VSVSEPNQSRPQPLDYANPHHQLARPTRWYLWIPLAALAFLVFIVLAGSILMPTFDGPGSGYNDVHRHVESAAHLRSIGRAILL
jgi:hypothetical protein